MQDKDQLEEERRLLYGGITRAKQKLDLLCSSRRRTYDKWVGYNPSRFLTEIPTKYFDTDPNQSTSEYYMDGVYDESESQEGDFIHSGTVPLF